MEVLQLYTQALPHTVPGPCRPYAHFISVTWATVKLQQAQVISSAVCPAQMIYALPTPGMTSSRAERCEGSVHRLCMPEDHTGVRKAQWEEQRLRCAACLASLMLSQGNTCLSLAPSPFLSWPIPSYKRSCGSLGGCFPGLLRNQDLQRVGRIGQSELRGQMRM